MLLDFIRKPVFLIILAAALIAGGIWAYLANRSNQQAQQKAQEAASQSASTAKTAAELTNLTNVAPETLTDSITAQLALADSKAAEVDKKLQLTAIEVDLPGTIEKNSGSTYYIYSTPNDKVNNWVIAISNADNKFVRSRTVKDDYMGSVTTINRSFLKTNFVAALQIAEKNGGQTFRQANTLAELKLTLKNAAPKNWLYWFVDYISKADQKEFQIDASSSALIAPSTTP